MTHRASRATTIVNGWARLLPDRIAEEDIGDYLEDVQRCADAGQRIRVWLRAALAIVWTGVNTIEFLVRRRVNRDQRQTCSETKGQA